MEEFAEWMSFLQEQALFGPNDSLFPPPEMTAQNGRFMVTGLKHECYAGAGPIREAIKDAFRNAGLHPVAPHSFRKTHVQWAEKHYPTREGFKAFSQNIGHDSVITTVTAYMPVSQERQGELIRGLD